MAIIGMDIHRSFAQAAFLKDGQIKREQRVDLVHDRLVKFAKTLSLEDEVVIEATANSAAVERILRPFVKRVLVANSRMVRAIAYARVKTDKIDAAILARLHAGGFLPEVWVADEDTQRQRRQTAERMGVLEQIVRTKGRIHAILHANLIPKYAGHLFGQAGKKWLAGLPLPDDEKAIVGRLVDELERNSDQLAKLDRTIVREALEDARVVRLMTIPGIGPIVASTVLASIGDISRFPTPEKLSCYFGLTPKVRQSGDRPARHGRISKQGNTHARKMLVEAAWSAKTAPGPLRAFFRTCPTQSGRARGGRRDREKAGGDDLACSDGRDRVRLRASRLHRHEATQSSAQGGRSARIWQGGTRSRLLDQGDPRAGSRLRGACRAGLRANGCGVEGKA